MGVGLAGQSDPLPSMYSVYHFRWYYSEFLYTILVYAKNIQKMEVKRARQGSFFGFWF